MHSTLPGALPDEGTGRSGDLRSITSAACCFVVIGVVAAASSLLCKLMGDLTAEVAGKEGDGGAMVPHRRPLPTSAPAAEGGTWLPISEG